MDVGCNCFGVATAAKVPVKRYNLLVPAIFPVTEPNPDKRLSVGVEKNIHRLSEYLGRNEHRIPKASRRLARIIHADLKRNRMGYVKVGVEAFQVLVRACESRFARLYAQELLVRYPKKSVHFAALHRESTSSTNNGDRNVQHETSVVGALLANKDVRAQRMGIELLLSILKIQDSAEYIASLDNFVPMLCRLAVEESRSESLGVSAMALQCLLEHLRLCSRISYIAKNMKVITWAVLEIIEHEGDAAIDAYEALKVAAGEAGADGTVGEHRGPELIDAAMRLALGRLSIGSRIGASPPCQAAVLIFREIGAVSHDSVESRNVVEYWISFMDQVPRRWSEGAALRVGLGILRESCTIEHQKYAMACALVRHLTSSSCSKDPSLFDSLFKVVLSQSILLGPTNTAAMLLLTIRTVGGMFTTVDSVAPIASSSNKGTCSPFAKTAREAVQTVSIQTGCRAQVASVIEAALLHPAPSSVVGTIFLCEAASAVFLDIPMNNATTISPCGIIASSRASEDLNVTETMVTAIQALSTSAVETQTDPDTNSPTTSFVIHQSLSILRHTLEATAPGSHTSARASRALMSFMWSVLGHVSATPSMLVAVQGLFRAFTETDMASNQGDVLATMFLASINRELALAAGATGADVFCDNVRVSPLQVAAVAVITRGMWECMNKSSVRGVDAFDAFKPIVSVADDSHALLETNSIGLAFVPERVDGTLPFAALQGMGDTSASISVTARHADPVDILKLLGMGELSPSLGRVEFLHGSENHSPRKTSRNIVSAISRVVSLDSAEVVDVARAEDFDLHSTPMAKVRAAMQLDDACVYESGMDALASVAQRV